MRVELMCKKAITAFERIYDEHFQMKVEDADIFIGIDMFVSDGGVECCGHSVNMNREFEIIWLSPRKGKNQQPSWESDEIVQ